MRISDWSSDVCSSDLLLRNTYEAIRTNGLVDEADPGFYTTRKLANRHAEHRELVFKDGDAWMRYDRKYGTGNPFTAIMGHLRGMSQDIASLERFGPRSEEHTSELQSLMRLSYAVSCLKKHKNTTLQH